jgi:hypothetical protein
MHWGAYEVFSVLSGVTFAIIGLLPGAAAKDRLWALLAGAAFIAYGIYVARQTSGTYYFPVWIFVIPFAGAIWAIARSTSRKNAQNADQAVFALPAPPVQPAVGAPLAAAGGAGLPDPAPCSACGATPARGTKFCTRCGAAVKAPTRVCAGCGAETAAAARFCHACGAPWQANLDSLVPQAVAVAVSGGAASSSLADELAKLAKLHDSGLLTTDGFAAAKAKLLA